MVLRFNNSWRASPPSDGRFKNQRAPEQLIQIFLNLALKVGTQGSRKTVIELFKSHIAPISGRSQSQSSDETWAIYDLEQMLVDAGDNAPLLIEGFYDACEAIRRRHPDWWIPDSNAINDALMRTSTGYQIQGQDLVPLEHSAPSVVLPPPPPSMKEVAIGYYETSLRRAEELLVISRPREAVQELLWLLETLSTQIVGEETSAGVIAGRYFNQIARDLRMKNQGTTLNRVLEWVGALHGYLSSPTGGGVRHGIDLKSGSVISENEGRLFCNLIRSYIAYLVVEYERISPRLNDPSTT